MDDMDFQYKIYISPRKSPEGVIIPLKLFHSTDAENNLSLLNVIIPKYLIYLTFVSQSIKLVVKLQTAFK